MRFLFNSHRIFILMVLLTTTAIIYVLYVKKDRRDFIKNYNSEEVDENGRHRMFKTSGKMSKIRYYIKQFNTQLVIHNSHLGPITKKTFVIVIQCHANIQHLERLLNTLKKVYFINYAFLIFSHSYFSDKMNKLILKIDYAQYMQIFYPYSIQLHPEVFPGKEPVSCTGDLPCEMSTSRDPGVAQSKHHWWWQANQIFHHLSVLDEFSQPILFLEANNYVLLDVLFVFRLLVNARNAHCTFCEMISLAAYKPEVSQYKKRKSIVALEVWKDTMHSTAIAFDRQVWHSIKASKELFCFYNDSKWDNSLKHLGVSAMQGNIYLMAIEGPRVFRIEECHVKDVGCNEDAKVNDVKHFTKLLSKRLFPQSLRIKVPADEEYNGTESGNWSDVRDQNLCMRFANESVWFPK